jgi:DNA-binding MarR family transcriptional regulator
MFADVMGLFDEVRLLEHQLIRTATALHGDLDVTIPGRAVLEFLHRSGPASVPEVARARLVSRQHIQAIVDGLLDTGHLERLSNPAHRRSDLLTLSAAGAALIAEMHQREERFLDPRLEGIDRADVTASTRLLAALRDRLEPDDRS